MQNIQLKHTIWSFDRVGGLTDVLIVVTVGWFISGKNIDKRCLTVKNIVRHNLYKEKNVISIKVLFIKTLTYREILSKV